MANNRAALSGGGMFIGHIDHSSENVVLSEPQDHELGNRSYCFTTNNVTGTNVSLTVANGSCLKVEKQFLC